MKYLQRLFIAVVAAPKNLKERKYHGLAALLVVAALIGLTSVLTASGPAVKHTALHAPDKPVKVSQVTTPTGNTARSTPAQLTDQSSTTPGQDTSAPTASTAPTSNQRTLQISPSTFTITAVSGQPIASQSISIQASNGKAINMPGFFTSTGGKFIFNFPAGPAKQTWNGQLMTIINTPPGTYSFDIFAQDTTTAYYKGSITITIVKPAPPPPPSMEIAVQSLGYDEENDAVDYAIRITRLNGLDEPVVNIVAYSVTDPDLYCYYAMVDADTAAMACLQEGDTRPTTGTLTISVDTASVTRFATASYSFPPLP